MPSNAQRTHVEELVLKAIDNGVLSNPGESVLYMDSATHKVRISENGGEYEDVAGAGVGGSGTPPVGVVFAWPTVSAPTGYLLCDGAAVSRTTYADLFALIGSTFGNGDGSTTFNLPNLKGRVPVGLDAAQSEFNELAEVGGAKTHTLIESEMPTHTHVQSAHGHGITDAGHSHLTQRYPTATGGSSGFTIDTSMSGTLADNTLPVKSSTTGVSVNNATATNQNAGGGASHNNLQPYLILNYIIKF